MKIGTIALAAAASIAVLAGSASAQTPNPNWQGRKKLFHIEQRENEQQKRINQGIENGSLTPNEAARLEREQARFEKVENRDRASGGKLTMREREQLYRDQNRMSRDIYREKHDRQRVR